MTNPSSKHPLVGLPTYLTLLWPKSIRWAISRLAVKRGESGLFEVPDPRGLRDRIAVGATRAEAFRKARAKVVAEREALALEGIFERKVLLRGLRVIETGNGWVVSEREIRVVLERIRRRRLQVYGIEAWRLHRKGGRIQEEFRDVRVHEQYRDRESKTHWYMRAFKEMVNRESRNYYSVTVGIPKRLIRSWKDRRAIIRWLRDFWRRD